ncbi:hypothetical protein [Pseudomonas sp. PA-1-3F]|uniref:hypothetical protein n=1 Tax=Pseudomonas sp. PA-1-3F TaxID=2665465 RepID=UPI001F37AE8D|nr:hypothetical protein [Pseudomonas sp. PA-1-3F]MCF5684917.1 hypothetical protein [Pseudomonas sp. PA-1-3F]
MSPQEIFNNFCTKTSELILLQRAARSNSDKNLENLHEAKKREALQDSPYENIPRSINRMFFYSAKTNELLSYGKKAQNIDDQINFELQHRNKQYQWILAEAYEIFEDYIEELYADIGFRDKNFWPLSDYGALTLHEIYKLNNEWHLNYTKERKKNKPSSILIQFRKKLGDLEKLEKTNCQNVNFRFAITFIEKLRHAIVHNNGRIDNKEKFIEKTLNESNINTPEKEKYRNTINSYIPPSNDNLIKLLERAGHPDIPFSYNDTLEEIIKVLVTYAHLLADCLSGHQSEPLTP